jgi:beta-fructofuranosidase
LAQASPPSGTRLYAARLVRDRTGSWNLLGSRYDEDDTFVGEITDPIPLEITDGALTEVSDRGGSHLAQRDQVRGFGSERHPGL